MVLIINVVFLTHAGWDHWDGMYLGHGAALQHARQSSAASLPTTGSHSEQVEFFTNRGQIIGTECIWDMARLCNTLSVKRCKSADNREPLRTGRRID